MLKIDNLQKSFVSPDGPSVPVVDVQSFTLAAAEQTALLGSSGSGKTTLLHLLAGILAADTGTIQYTLQTKTSSGVIDLAKLSEPERDHFRGQHIGYIFQTHHLMPGLTALENVLLGMSFTGRSPDRTWATHLLERVGLSHRLTYKPGKMSVGQQQRVAVARALANRPQLVLADEPTGALDAISAQQTLDLIRSLCSETSAALILVTHDLAIAHQLSRQVQLSSIQPCRRNTCGGRGGKQMNIFQLILKQMRQRSLSTFLTTLSILLAVALATSIMIIDREGRTVFAQTDYGYDLLVGPKASPLQLVLNTVYHLDVSPGNIPYSMYEDMISSSATTADGKKNEFRGMVEWAVPYAVGDSYYGRRIVGTTSTLFGIDDDGKALPPEKTPEYRQGMQYSFAAGRAFDNRKFEAVMGSEVAKDLGLTIGKTFQATHGFPGPNDIPDIHPEVWTVVGILNETHTANDRCLFIPIRTFYAIFEHETGLEAIANIKGNETGAVPAPPKPPKPETVPANEGYTPNADGTINNRLPKADWEVSAILVKAKSASSLLQMQFLLRNMKDAVGVNPAGVMQQFFDTFLSGTFELLFLIATLVLVVAGVSILVSIYNSVAARTREIAIMRALGATRQRIMAIICLEAGIVGLLGGILGVIAGHLLALGGSAYLQTLMGSGIAWWRISPIELLYLVVVVAVSLLAGLVPAAKAYQTPVAENLLAG